MTLAREFESAEDTGRMDATELREVVESLFSDENINLKSVLNAEQVVALTTALAFADEYKVELIKKVALYFMQLKVSEKARGRTDMRSVLMSFLGKSGVDDSDEFKKLMGR